MDHILYLASKSASRKKLLERAGIAYRILEQNADESRCDWNLPLRQVVESIAHYKMEEVIMPPGQEGMVAYVVTADTLSIDTTGAISGKPIDMSDAIAKVKAARNGINRCGTSFCLEKRVFESGVWKTHSRISKYAEATYEFEVPDQWIEKYIQETGSLEAAGAIKIEDGPQFLKSVNGSYTAIIGLPMFELWQALEETNFFDRS